MLACGKAALCLPLVSCGTRLSTHSAPSFAGGKVVAPATKGGALFPAHQGGLPVFHRAKPGCKVFLYIAPAGRHQNPLNHLNPLNLLNLWIEAAPRPLSKNHLLNFRNPIHIGHFLPFKHGSLFLSFQSGEDTDESGAGPAASKNVGVGVAADVDFIVL